VSIVDPRREQFRRCANMVVCVSVPCGGRMYHAAHGGLSADDESHLH
jgi:hypothetical protein